MNLRKRAEETWTSQLFTRYPHLYLPELLRLEPQSQAEVDGIIKIMNHFRIDSGSRVLDFSCGIGRHSILLAKSGYDIVGYDPSSFFLKVAREKVGLEKSDLRIRFYQGDPTRVSNVLLQNRESDFKAIIIMYNSKIFRKFGS